MKTQTKTQPKGWKETTLGEVLKIRNGKSRPKDGKKHPVYGGNGILGYADEYNVDEKIIIVGRVGAYCGSIFSEKEKIWLSDNALGVLAKENVDIDFLYYLLKKINLNKQAIGGAQPLLTQGIINQIEVVIPENESEQNSIASVLSSLDYKIKLLQKQNETLEAIARTIFHEWFVEFNFPNENGKPHKASGGKMVESELGEIPEGWRVGKLGDIAEVDWGNTNLTKKAYKENGEFLGVSASGCDGRMEHAEYKFGVSVISAIGEYCGRVFLPPEDFTAIKNTLVVRQKETVTSFFSYLGLQVWGLKRRGAAQPFLSKGDTEQIALALPHPSLLKDFELAMGIFFQKSKNNHFQIGTLSKLRDTLLPKLMSGEVRVKI